MGYFSYSAGGPYGGDHAGFGSGNWDAAHAPVEDVDVSADIAYLQSVADAVTETNAAVIKVLAVRNKVIERCNEVYRESSALNLTIRELYRDKQIDMSAEEIIGLLDKHEERIEAEFAAEMAEGKAPT